MEKREKAVSSLETNLPVLAKIQNAALVRVLQHGRDQTAVDGYRHGDVDVLVEERPLLPVRAVHYPRTAA